MCQLEGSVTTLFQKYLVTISNGKRVGGHISHPQTKSWIFQSTCFSRPQSHALPQDPRKLSSEVIPRNKQSPLSVSERPRSISFRNSGCVLPSSPLPQQSFPAYRRLTEWGCGWKTRRIQQKLQLPGTGGLPPIYSVGYGKTCSRFHQVSLCPSRRPGLQLPPTPQQMVHVAPANVWGGRRVGFLSRANA